VKLFRVEFREFLKVFEHFEPFLCALVLHLLFLLLDLIELLGELFCVNETVSGSDKEGEIFLVFARSRKSKEFFPRLTCRFYRRARSLDPPAD
jgi:hypothetical protein